MGRKELRKKLLLRLVGFRVFVGGLAILLLSPLYMYFSHDVDRLNREWPQVVPGETPEERVDYEFVPKPPPYWVRLNQISHYAKWAIVLSEDWGFYEHEGVDFVELKKAVDESMKEKRLVRGASTISQQLVKNVFLSSSRSLLRKAHEIVLTQKMEKVVPKARILETYFNIVEWGPGIYGIKAASLHYFRKHPSGLNPREAAFLAMLLPSPKRYYVSFRQKRLTRFARSRVQSTLRKLKMARIISEGERQLWLQTPMSWER
jgi:monofunctional glycosyltransferase